MTTANPLPEDAVVRVHAVDKRSTPVTVNQRTVEVPHNEDFPLAGPYVEALQNSSRVNFTIVRPLEKGEKPAGADLLDDKAPSTPSAPVQPYDQKPGGDNMTHGAPQEPNLILRSDGPAINQKPGGDNLTHAGPVDFNTSGEERSLAVDAAIRERQAANDGTIAPVRIIANPDGGTGGEHISVADAREAEGFTDNAGNGELVDTSVLDGTVDEVLERAEDMNPAQRAALLAAEKARDKPRKGVLDGLAPQE